MEDSLSTLINSDLLNHWPKERSKKRALQIIEAAIACYAENGIETTTYESIAKKAGISRPLIFKYFKDYSEILFFAVQLVRTHFQYYAVTYMEKEKTTTGELKAYVYSTFQWPIDHQGYGSVFLLYLQRCMTRPKERDLNTQYSLAGEVRITELLREGAKSGDFSKDIDFRKTAQLIQTYIAGAMITQASTHLEDQNAYQEMLWEQILKLLKK